MPERVMADFRKGQWFFDTALLAYYSASTVPKSPSFSSLGPAVKNSAFIG